MTKSLVSVVLFTLLNCGLALICCDNGEKFWLPNAPVTKLECPEESKHCRNIYFHMKGNEEVIKVSCSGEDDMEHTFEYYRGNYTVPGEFEPATVAGFLTCSWQYCNCYEYYAAHQKTFTPTPSKDVEAIAASLSNNIKEIKE